MDHLKSYSQLNEDIGKWGDLDQEVRDILNIAKDEEYPMDIFKQFKQCKQFSCGEKISHAAVAGGRGPPRPGASPNN